ncbi:hypothetical protein [Sulfuricurvum sp. RIFCSPLOWO2_12_FULL_43_24]|uniref:hypothetical protein n=1 Tax=Sulfuricurvum sp. RIFCSPLOWO2_12_FULL_43_24 TaxID=1802247 RepID=UPI0008AEE286|nr:hypothetical protein [Sulfuricurvum sp. RIFCSPLOWO2_12_FULL_43_24]OHD89072.1 MAG: hypothetical protein A3G19_07745 [Sulfuricurvum sp. RIFCSPLOWO2_12_FULL_43_24]
MEEKKVKKPFKQQWEEFDFCLATKFAIHEWWGDFKALVTGGSIPQRISYDEYVEAFYAKKNSKN